MQRGERGESLEYAIRRWQRVKRAMRPEDRVYVERLVKMLERHAGEFAGMEDPLEAVVAAVLIEMLKELDAGEGRRIASPAQGPPSM